MKFLTKQGLQRFFNNLKAIIPTKTSDIQNDSGFLNTQGVQNYMENGGGYSQSEVNTLLASKADSAHTHSTSDVSGLSTVATSGSYTDLSNTPAIPTKTSELTNDSGFITAQDAYDSSLSSTSENAVQNKVVNAALNGKSDTGHTHAASEVSGLANVATSGSYNDLSNTPAIPTVNNATLTIQKNGSTVKTFTANASSNVTANITVPTNVSDLTNDSGYLTPASSLDSSKLTGTIDIARLPKGALERLITVANQTARYALTVNDVQLGDTVKQLDTGVMYIVVDESKLSSADGYTEYTAGSATSVPWSGVTNKPSDYTPSSHSHGNIANGGTLGTASRALITDSNKKITTSSVTSTELGYVSGVTSAIQTQLDGKAASSHTHTASDVSGLSTVATSGSYNDLSNKPTIPTVNNATLTIQQNGTTVKTFTANASSNVTANITVPTKTSDLTNDSHQTITTDTDTTSAESPAHSGTFTCIDSVTRDSNGHVTKVNTKTITLPSDNNTDTLVAQNYSTANNSYPVVFSSVAGVSSTSNRGNKNTIVNNAIYANPSTGSLYATKLYSGGNEVLTSHQSLSNYSTLANTVKSISISGKTITVTPGSGSAYTLTTQDTVYTHPTTSGNKHIPSGGSSGQFLGWDSDGTAKWVNNPNTNTDTLMTQNVSTTNATYPVLLVATANATANQGAKTGIFAKSVKVNPSTNVISASGFSGPLTGNVTGNCSGSSGSCTGNAATATQFSADKDVTLTGYINGTASSKAGWSIATALKNGYASTGGTVTNTYFKIASGTLTGGWNRYETLIRFVETTGNSSCTLRVYISLDGSSLFAAGNVTVLDSVNFGTSPFNVVYKNDTDKTLFEIYYQITPKNHQINALVLYETQRAASNICDVLTMYSQSTPVAALPSDYTLIPAEFEKYCGDLVPAGNNKNLGSTDAKWSNVYATTFTGNLTGNVTGNVSGTAANVTGTVAIANGGTGATSRTSAVANLFNANIGTSPSHFLTGTANFANSGYSSVANVKTALGLGTATFENNTGRDANTVSFNGINYYTSNGPATSLGASTNDGALYSQAWSDKWVAQIAQDYRNGNLFVRGKNNGTWTSWKIVAYHGDNISKFTNDAGYLTSHQSLSNYVTLNGTQTITGAKTFSGLTKTAGKTEQSSPSNLNDALYNVETYSWGTSTTNKPSSSYGILLNLNREGNVHSSTSNGWRAQLGVGTDTRLYLRTKANTGGEWSAWKEFLTSHQSLSNYSTLANTIKSLSISGKTITYTKGDNTTGTLTTQDTNTDTLMTQNVSTTNATYPVLLVATADATANQGAKTGIFAKSVKVNPSTNVISASGFSGPLTGNVTGNCSGSSGSCTGNAATATKLATARSIALGNELAGSANFDGSGNITINGSAYLSVVSIGNKNNYPYHCFAKFGPITTTYQDAAIKLLVSRQYIDGGTGIIELEFRTNATNGDGQCSIRWIVRSSKIPVDCIQVGFYKTWGGIYADVFYKSSGAYDSCVIRSMGDGSRASYERRFTLQDSNEANNTTTTNPLTSVNSYASIAAAGKALHNRAYTDILTAADAGVVETANTCSGNSATASKVVATVANDTTGTLVQGTMGSNDCFRIAIGGASNAGWAEIATGDDYNEPIYVRQYQGSFATLKRTATLLDASGNTSFPGTVTATGFSGSLTGNVTGNCSGSSGSCTGNSATATKATGNANGKELTNTIIKGLSISGKTITYTQIDGSTGTLTTQDTNTDTLMTQNVSTTNNKYPILLCPTAEATANQGAKTGIFGANALINPSTGEIISKSNGTGAFRVVGGKYGFFIRNDGSNTYFLMTASGDQYGTWTSARPLTINNSTGVCSINGNAATATKLATTRAINGTNFDGSAAITTANWGTARNIYIADSDATNTGSAVSVNGSGNATLKLPATIKASITGNCSGSSGSVQRYVGAGGYADILQTFQSDNNNYRSCSIRCTNGNGFNQILLGVHNESNGAPSGISVINTNGTVTTEAPTPATSDNSTKIATTAYVKAQGYLTSHQDLSLYPYKLASKTSSAQYWPFIDLGDTTTYPNGFNDLMDTGKYDVRAVIGTTPNAPSITTAPYIQGILEVEWLRTTENTSSYKRIIQKFHRVGPTSAYDIFIRRAYLNSSSVWVWADWEQVVTIEDIPKIVFAYASRSAITDAGNGSYKRVSANSLYYCYFVNGSFTVTSTKVGSSGTYELQSGGVSQTPGTDKICGLWIKIA